MSTLPRTLAVMTLAGLSLTACSSTHPNGATTQSVTPTSSSATSDSTSPSTDTSSASTSVTSTDTSSSSSNTNDGSTSDPLSSLAMQGNAPTAATSSGASSQAPRGGTGSAPDLTDGTAQVVNFLKTNFSYDTRIDTSESGAAARAAQYASGALAASLRSPVAASPEFSDAAKHHGYTTVSISDTNQGQPSASDSYLTVCKAVTLTWHGNAGWNAPKPTTNVWCATALADTQHDWTVNSVDLVGEGS